MSEPIALVHGPNRAANITAALDLVGDQIDLRGRRLIIVKPNLVSLDHPLSCTHPAALEAVLAWVRTRTDAPLAITEGAAMDHTPQSFRRYGFDALARRYNATLVDLNADATIPVRVYDRQLRPQVLRLARTAVESDCRISVGPPKTHDTVVVTLALKNMIMGALVNPMIAAPQPQAVAWVRVHMGRLLRRAGLPLGLLRGLGLHERSDKIAMHQGYPAINLNLAMLAPWVKPHLAVLDGFVAMEGAGPVHGTAVDWQLAMAGTDALALDSLAAWMMGFDPARIGYLAYCARLGLGESDPGRIPVCGTTDPAAARRCFRPHPTTAAQLQWQLPAAASRLQPAPLASGR